MKSLDSISDSMDLNFSKFREIVKDRKACRAAVLGLAKSWLFTSGDQRIGTLASVLPMNIQG